MNSYQRVMATIEGRPHDRAPLSLMVMAWAGHHIGRNYRDYALDPGVTVASHLAMVRDFAMDTVTVQTDPWCEAEAYGMCFDYPEEGVGIPRRHLVEEDADRQRIAAFDPMAHDRTRRRIEAVGAYALQLKQTVPIIGWVEGPIAEYADLRGLEWALIDMIEQPGAVEEAFEDIVDNAIRFARMQIEAGADIIGVGDAAASVIGPELYRQRVLPWERKLFDGIHAAGARVKLHICGNIRPLLNDIATAGVDILDVDWMVPLTEARAAMGQRVTLCGNFNPVTELMQCSPEQAAAAAARCVREGGDRFILQAGCETPPGTPVDNVRAVCETVTKIAK
jgi:MtaA/CmuA family methyltransferase